MVSTYVSFHCAFHFKVVWVLQYGSRPTLVLCHAITFGLNCCYINQNWLDLTVGRSWIWLPLGTVMKKVVSGSPCLLYTIWLRYSTAIILLHFLLFCSLIPPQNFMYPHIPFILFAVWLFLNIFSIRGQSHHVQNVPEPFGLIFH